MHACVKCGCTVFTLSPPSSEVGGVRINTGIKLATCMECGNQDRPVEVDQYIRQKEEKAHREQMTYAEMKRRKEEEDKYRLRAPYEQLLAEWLKQFNKYTETGVQPNEPRNEDPYDTYIREWHRERSAKSRQHGLSNKGYSRPRR